MEESVMRKLFSALLTFALIIGTIGLVSFFDVQAVNIKLSVNGIYYPSFEEGWNAAVAAETAEVVLFDDWKANGGSMGSGSGFNGGRIYAKNRANIILDLNGHIIDREMTSNSSKGQIFYIEDHAKITICDSSEGHTGQIRGANADDGGAFYMFDSAELMLIDVTVCNNRAEDYGGAICFEESSKVYLKGATVIRNNGTDYCGGAIYAGDDAVLEIGDNVVVEKNKAQYGGGLYIEDDAKVYMRGNSVVTENVSMKEGGGIYLYWYAKGYLYDNSKVSANYALKNCEGAELVINNATVEAPGGIKNENATLTVDGGSFKGSVNSGVALKGTITGGNFSPEMIDFLRNYAASGYVTAKSSDGTEYTVVENVYYTYLGAGLKYSGATADSAKIRFGYDFADDFDLEASDWRWNYGILNKDNLNQSISGENYDSKNVTNLVVAGIVPRRYNDPIYAQLSFNINIDDKTYTIEDSIRGTYINYLAAAIKNNESEPETVKEYAKQLIEEYIYNTQK